MIDVGHFWGFRTDESSVEKQCQLTAALNIRDLRPVSVSLYPNLLCVAPFKDGQQMAKYYRAKVLHILGSNIEVYAIHTQVYTLTMSQCRIKHEVISVTIVLRVYMCAGVFCGFW